MSFVVSRALPVLAAVAFTVVCNSATAADARRSAFFVGRVLDARGNVPELGTVAASDPNTGNGEPKTIQADTGDFRLGPLLPGTWDLYVLVSGHPPLKFGRFTLAADETHDVGTMKTHAFERIDHSGQSLSGRRRAG